MEPNTTRYAIAPAPLGVTCQRLHSPSSVPTRAIAAPPAIIWIAAPTYGLVSVRCRLLYTEPSDHEALAHVRAIGPRRSARRISAGLAPTSRAVPRKPSRSPDTTRQFKSPEPPGMIASKNAIHRATVTTKMLAMPDAVYCSAQTTRSEERRVGKECRSRWAPHQYKQKHEQAASRCGTERTTQKG